MQISLLNFVNVLIVYGFERKRRFFDKFIAELHALDLRLINLSSLQKGLMVGLLYHVKEFSGCRLQMTWNLLKVHQVVIQQGMCVLIYG